MVQPDATRDFAAQRGCEVCLNRLLDVVLPDAAWNLATTLLNMGGLGLRSAVRGRPAAFFASWAGGLEMINKRHPSFADLIFDDLGHDRPSHHLSALVHEVANMAGVNMAG